MADTPKTENDDQTEPVVMSEPAEHVEEVEDTVEDTLGDSEEVDPASEPRKESVQPDEQSEDLLSAEEISEHAPTPKRSGLGTAVGLVLGGVIAAAIGFGAARYVVPEGWPFPGTVPEEDPMAGALADQAARIDGLEAALMQTDAALKTADSSQALSDLTAQLQEIQAGIDTLSTKVDSFDARIVTLEKAPAGGGADVAEAAAAAYERDLAEMRAMLDDKLAEISQAQAEAQALEADAAEAARAATGRAALSRIMVALDSGQAFDGSLAELTEATDLTIPEALSAQSAGVPTLSVLQADFPEAARASLDAALRAAAEAGEISRFDAFWRTQLGARSLTPQEGGDPDAVLSRVEASLAKGELAAALDEIATLPEAAQPAMADWVAKATARADALAGAATLAQQLNDM